jgi:hypothetical protein
MASTSSYPTHRRVTRSWHFSTILRTVTINEDQIRKLLERYGRGMSEDDLAEIAGCWELPALALYDEGPILIANSAELERFFTRIIVSYRSQGFLATRPEIERTEELTARIVTADVRWPSFDEAGVERSSERTHYVLWLGDDGQLYIKVGIPRTR